MQMELHDSKPSLPHRSAGRAGAVGQCGGSRGVQCACLMAAAAARCRPPGPLLIDPQRRRTPAGAAGTAQHGLAATACTARKARRGALTRHVQAAAGGECQAGEGLPPQDGAKVGILARKPRPPQPLPRARLQRGQGADQAVGARTVPAGVLRWSVLAVPANPPQRPAPWQRHLQVGPHGCDAGIDVIVGKGHMGHVCHRVDSQRQALGLCSRRGGGRGRGAAAGSGRRELGGQRALGGTPAGGAAGPPQANAPQRSRPLLRCRRAAPKHQNTRSSSPSHIGGGEVDAVGQARHRHGAHDGPPVVKQVLGVRQRLAHQHSARRGRRGVHKSAVEPAVGRGGHRHAVGGKLRGQHQAAGGHGGRVPQALGKARQRGLEARGGALGRQVGRGAGGGGFE